MSKYIFDIKRLLSLVPISMRKPNMLQLVKCFFVPLSNLYVDFTIYRKNKEYRLDHNAQVYSLRQVVCDFCGSDDCQIEDSSFLYQDLVPHNGYGDMVHYQLLVPHDLEISPQVYFLSGYEFMEQACFIVRLPLGLSVDERALRALIDSYKLAGKTYMIAYGDAPAYDRYWFIWGNEVCYQTDISSVNPHRFSWSNLVCVQEGIHGFIWSGHVCIQSFIDLPYEYGWSASVCIQKDNTVKEKYAYHWGSVSRDDKAPVVCVQVGVTIKS